MHCDSSGIGRDGNIGSRVGCLTGGVAVSA